MNPAEFLSLARSERDLWWFRGMRTILFNVLDSFIRKRVITRVLEAGCGTGYTADLLNQRYGWSVVAADVAQEGILRMRRSDKLIHVQTNIKCFPFRSDSFDAVFCLDVLVHFQEGDESRAVAELSRVLNAGGLLVLRTSAFKWLRSRHSQFTYERQRFSRAQLVKIVEKQGFRVLRCTYLNSLLLPVALARFRLWEPLLKAQASSGTTPLPLWLNQLLYIPLAIEALLISRFNFPLGQTILLLAKKRD
ncbi:MAG: class I SAM-dependent methyltransferase [Bryobacteraceae bacterium]